MLGIKVLIIIASTSIAYAKPNSKAVMNCKRYFSGQVPLREYYSNSFLIELVTSQQQHISCSNSTHISHDADSDLNNTSIHPPAEASDSSSINGSPAIYTSCYNKVDNSTHTQQTIPMIPSQGPRLTLAKSNFTLLEILGRGRFGNVWKISAKNSTDLYALKEMRKSVLIESNSVKSIIEELKIVSHLHHPLIIQIFQAFQDTNNLYLVEELLSGGTLRSHTRHYQFSESQTKFLVSCIVLGLDYIHSNGVLHKDIKPDNLLFDSKGYVKLADFGLAKVWTPENFRQNSGTRKYMSPEVLCRQNHGTAADYFAIGVILYEIMMGHKPYVGSSRQELKYEMLNNPVRLEDGEITGNWSEDAVDFINQLLEVKPWKRLGYNGFDEVKLHPWLQGVDWEGIANQSATSPFLQSIQAPFEKNKKEEREEDEDSHEIEDGELGLCSQELFKDYYYESDMERTE